MPETVEILEMLRRGLEVSKATYELTATSIPPEIFGMSSPLRRVAEAIPANLAEAAESASHREAVPFAQHALESSYEVDTLLSALAKSETELPPDVVALQEKLADVAERIASYIESQGGVGV